MEGGGLNAAEQASESGSKELGKEDPQQEESSVIEERSLAGDEPVDKKLKNQQEVASSAMSDVQENSQAPITAENLGATVDESGKESKDEENVVPMEQLSIQEKSVQESLRTTNVASLNGSIVHVSSKEEKDQKEAVAWSEDEQRMVQEMRAMIIEQDPLSKDTDEATLRRFLRARSWKVPKAVKMFVDHQKWRRSYIPLGHIPQEEIKNELAAEKVFMQGHDKKERPIAVILASKHDANKRKYDEFKRFCVFSFDAAVTCMKPGEETFTVILDLKGLAYKNLDIRGWISTFDFLQAYYPERLGRLFIVHVPTIFWGAWKLVYPFVDKVTRDKIVFVEDNLLQQKLEEEINKDQIPTIYGGMLPLMPIQNAVTPDWSKRQADAPQST